MTKTNGVFDIVKKTIALTTPNTLKLRASRHTSTHAHDGGESAVAPSPTPISPLDSVDHESIMGKSNKFDFTNRKSSGVDLGKSISKALVKEAEKLHKDAEKAAGKARKQSSSSSIDNYDVPLDAHSHIVDLQAPAKDLGDDGLCALVDGLEAALRSGDAQASLSLEDLNLSGNALSTESLARLAPIIKLAKLDLKTVNLSSNNISVQTDAQAEQWEVFLRSFGDCYKLRRLDISENSELGERAFEILARVYQDEPAITPIPPGGDCSVLSLVSEQSEDNDNDSQADDCVLSDALEHGGFLRRRSGLRSIPYITLQKTGLTDTGALWLSYILEEHHYPTQLTDEVNAPPYGTVIKTYQQGGEYRGVDWTENKSSLGKDGAFLLQKIEIVRSRLFSDDHSTMGDSIVIEDIDTTVGDGVQAKKALVERRFSQAGNRRPSIRSIRTTDGGEHEMSELERARKKIQRHAIDHDKVKSVDLWYAGLKVVAAARIICWAAPGWRRHYTGPSLFNPISSPIKSPTSRRATLRAYGKTSAGTNGALRSDSVVRPSYAAKLNVVTNGTVGEPETAITEVTNSPVTPKMVFKPHRKGAFSEGIDLPAVTERLGGLVVRDCDPMRFVRYQEQRIEAVQGGMAGYRDTSNVAHLPNAVMDHIISFILSHKEAAVLSKEQRRAAMTWGFDRATLRTELEWRKKDESFQAWMLLDGVKCLAYGQ